MCHNFCDGAVTFFAATFRPSRPAQSIRMTFLHISQWCDIFLQSDSSQRWVVLKLVTPREKVFALHGKGFLHCTVTTVRICALHGSRICEGHCQLQTAPTLRRITLEKKVAPLYPMQKRVRNRLRGSRRSESRRKKSQSAGKKSVTHSVLSK